MSGNAYQEAVIRDGKLVADWDSLYSKYDDPWEQSQDYQRESASRVLIKHNCELLRSTYGSEKTLELGCGLGFLTESLHKMNFKSRGTDISQVCISKALSRNPFLDLHVSAFDNQVHLIDWKPDILIMSQLSWYVLNELQNFLALIKSAPREKPLFLIHTLAIYQQGEQKYGTEYFTNLDEILNYFNLTYSFSATLNSVIGEKQSLDTIFIAKL
jgi:hypothetical protein